MMRNFYEDEELGIIVIKKINKKRLFILILTLLLLIFLLSTFIYVFHINKRMIDLEKEQQLLLGDNNISEQDNEEIIEEEQTEQQVPETKIEIRLPEFTDKGRENIKNIYISNEKTAYLTFDDGPSSNITPQILSTLDQYNIKATFFLLGQNVERYPELVKEEYEKGHYVANHGYTHIYEKIYSSPQVVLDEYMQTEQAIRNALDIQEYSSHLFRFPGGSAGTKYKNIKSQAKTLLADNNIAYMDWNALTNDSVGKPTEESIIKNLVDTVGNKNSVVILMHDAATKQLTADTLPQAIEYLQEQGYSFKNFYDVMK